MADTEQNNSIDAVATAPTGVKKRLPLIAAIVAGLAVGAGTGAVVVGPAAAKALGFGVEAPADSTVESEHGDADSLASAGSPPAVLTLDNLVLNPAASGGTRFLLLTVAMECGDAAVLATLQSRDAELRDVVLSTLSRKTVDELADVAQREGIKSELQTALNDRFGKKSVLRVYFPQYVVQ
jgi:flagellar FliL protein